MLQGLNTGKISLLMRGKKMIIQCSFQSVNRASSVSKSWQSMKVHPFSNSMKPWKVIKLIKCLGIGVLFSFIFIRREEPSKWQGFRPRQRWDIPEAGCAGM